MFIFKVAMAVVTTSSAIAIVSIRDLDPTTRRLLQCILGLGIIVMIPDVVTVAQTVALKTAEALNSAVAWFRVQTSQVRLIVLALLCAAHVVIGYGLALAAVRFLPESAFESENTLTLTIGAPVAVWWLVLFVLCALIFSEAGSISFR